MVPMLDEAIELAAEAGRARGRDRHGAPRPAERARAHARAAVRGDPARVRGRAHDRGRRLRPPRAAPATSSTTSAPRAFARRRPARSPSRSCANPSHLEAVDPVVEGRARAEQTDRSTRAGVPRPGGRAADPDPRRRRVRRPGGRRRDAQPRRPRRLLDRRHAPPDRQQPGRLHDRPRRGPLDALLERPRQGLRHPDHPRQRRRPRGGDLAAIRLALAFRRRFGHDVVIDLVGYRRFGHNEQDEPAYTQPLMAARSREHPTVREQYAARLVEEGVVPAGGGGRSWTGASRRRCKAAHERAEGDVRRAEPTRAETPLRPGARPTTRS